MHIGTAAATQTFFGTLEFGTVEFSSILLKARSLTIVPVCIQKIVLAGHLRVLRSFLYAPPAAFLRPYNCMHMHIPALTGTRYRVPGYRVPGYRYLEVMHTGTIVLLNAYKL